MRIALCAPVDLISLARFCSQDEHGVAAGLGGTITTSLVCEFLRRGHEVTLYTLSKDLTRSQSYRCGNLRVVAGPFRKRHLARGYYWPEITFLSRAIRADDPPFVHAHWTYEFALGALRSGALTLTTIHDLPWNVFRHYRDAHRAIRLMMAYEVALRGKHFSAVSKAAATHFARYFKPGAQIPIVPNGLRDETFALGKANPPRSHRAITFATILQGWSRRKNGEVALKAFKTVRRDVPQAKLVMFGSGYEHGGPAHRWAAAHGLDREVLFAGEVAHEHLLPLIARDIDIVIHPSLDEAFSMAALESLALQKPLIAGERTPGMREMLGPGGGVLVDVRSPSMVAQAMAQLTSNADYRHHLAHRSYERAHLLYRMPTVAAAYEALYLELLRPHATSIALQPRAESHASLDL